jgi:RNA-splicing ligase RtcB
MSTPEMHAFFGVISEIGFADSVDTVVMAYQDAGLAKMVAKLKPSLVIKG